MSILASIKEDRKMSLQHWRYRLLHWVFNVSPATMDEAVGSGMPRYLYTHYCPLFHLTNLIAIFSPLILFIKILAVIVKAAWFACGVVPWSSLVSWIKLPEWPKAPPPPPLTEDELRFAEKAKMKNLLLFCQVNDFNMWWGCHNREFPLLGEEGAAAIFADYMPRIIEAREARERRKQVWRDKLIFWTNFSRVFIKWSLNVLYVLLGLTVAYIVYLVAMPIVSFLSWAGMGLWRFLTDINLAESLAMIWFFAKLLLVVVIAGAVFAALMKIGWMQKFVSLCLDGLCKLTAPLYVFVIFWGWIRAGWRNTVDFISMFYEENCPPIILVSPEEESIAKIEKGEDQ